MMYAIKVYGRAVPTQSVKNNQVFWITKTEYGSFRIGKNLLIFKTEEEADNFGSTWEGHPHWVRPKRYEVVEVEPITETIITGYKPK